MGMYWKSSHCVYDCRYHLVWITKYRRPALSKLIQKRLSIILREVCDKFRVRILNLGFEEDHVHLYVSIPVVHPIPMLVHRLKGVSSFQLRKEFGAELSKFYWSKKVLWAVGYFVATVGEVNHETIKKYVEEQGKLEIENDCIEVKDTLIV